MKTKILLNYLLVFVLFTVVFLLLFRSPLFKGQTVLFYRGSFLLALTFFLFAITPGVIRGVLKVKYDTFFAALMMSASIHLAIFVVFPVTFDRSITMYLLNRLAVSQSPSCQGLSQKEMEQLFIKEYVKRDQAMNRRIKEQSIIKMLEKQNNCVSLTSRGHNFLKLSEFIKWLYALN
jgi:hypothetical protein